MSQALDNFRAAPVQQVTLSGVPVHYRTFGQGPAVLVLHELFVHEEAHEALSRFCLEVLADSSPRQRVQAVGGVGRE